MKKTTLLLAHLLTRRACLWAALVALSPLAFGPPPARAAVTEAWVHRYHGVVSNASDQAVKVVRDAAGDIIVTGTTYDLMYGQDMLTIKYSGADGSVLWQQRYNGPTDDNQANAVAVDGTGNVIVTGYSSNGTNYDYYTAKYAAADGALLWEQRYNGPANGYDQANAVAVDDSGNVVVTGSSTGTNGYDNYYTAKYAAADGALLWEQRYNGSGEFYGGARAVAVDGSGNVVVTGSSYSGRTSPYDYDYYTAKYAAADGALLWEQRYNGPANNNDAATAVAVDGSGNVLVTGSSADSRGYSDYYTAKYAAADGALLWEKRYHGPVNSDDRAYAVAVDSSGNVLVTGSSRTIKYLADGTGVWTNNTGGIALAVDASGNVVVTGGYTVKYVAASGALLWEKRYYGSNGPVSYAQAVAMDGGGNVVVTGYSNGTNSNADYYTAKYAAANGALLWEQRYSGPVHYGDYAHAVAVDGSGNVVVTGSSATDFESGLEYFIYDYYTAKYAAADGALLWERRYNGPSAAGDGDEARAVAVDGSGNVVVTGSSFGTNYSYADYYTVKYAAADGALLWEKRYNGPANSDDRASAVAVDGSGNVVVTGYSSGTNGYSDYYTAKYAAANGALLWEKRYHGPTRYNDEARAVAVDTSGNVVVTGSSATIKYLADGTGVWTNHGGGAALAVDVNGNVVVAGGSIAKYAAANGALLWEQSYTNFGANAVAVDSGGNVVVTGSFNNGGGYYDNDFYTAKYAAANGALLWAQRYNGPANNNDAGTAVAVDGSGNVVVTGSSASRLFSFGNVSYPIYDYYTAKYAAADGALLWEKRYNGPDNGDNRVAGLALGPNGMVAVTGSSSSDYATVVYRENLPPVSIAMVPAGIRLRFTGIPGRSYTIERAPAVTGPWTTLNTQTAPASGLLEYIDDPPAGSAFYRTAQP